MSIMYKSNCTKISGDPYATPHPPIFLNLKGVVSSIGVWGGGCLQGGIEFGWCTGFHGNMSATHKEPRMFGWCSDFTVT